MKLPPNCLIQYPTGSWGFVGRVDADLAYINTDGSVPTDEQFSKARQFGERFGHFTTRTFSSKESALAAAGERTVTL